MRNEQRECSRLEYWADGETLLI